VRTLATTGLAAFLVTAASGCTHDQDLSKQASVADHEVVIGMFNRVWEETDDPFEARRQVYAKHFGRISADPVLSRNLDALTALAWVAQGGEAAGAVCYMRGFQFGTDHHSQCVYEVKMEGGPRL
jgi:hypothetical protein